MFEQELLSGKRVHLAEYDPDVDAAVEAAWTNDPCYRLLMEYEKHRGWTPGELKKHYETHLKDSDEHRGEFYMGIKANTDNRLAGVFAIPWVAWTNRTLQFRIGFGDSADLQNWGPEAFKLALGYMFDELNMHLVTIRVPQFCPLMVEAVEEAGMVLTARRREVIYHNGRYHASFNFSMLQPAWQALKAGKNEN
jgi:RimJ/RimL family protein N-acetyltransferase